MKHYFFAFGILILSILLISCPVAPTPTLAISVVSTPFGKQVVASYGSAGSARGSSRSLETQPAGVTFYTTDENVATVSASDLTVAPGSVAALDSETGLVTPIDPSVAAITVIATDGVNTSAPEIVELTPIDIAGSLAVQNTATGASAALWRITTITDTLTSTTYHLGDTLPAGSSVEMFMGYYQVWVANSPDVEVLVIRNEGSPAGTHGTIAALSTVADSLNGKLNAGFTYPATNTGALETNAAGDGMLGDTNPWQIINGVYTNHCVGLAMVVEYDIVEVSPGEYRLSLAAPVLNILAILEAQSGVVEGSILWGADGTP